MQFSLVGETHAHPLPSLHSGNLASLSHQLRATRKIRNFSSSSIVAVTKSTEKSENLHKTKFGEGNLNYAIVTDTPRNLGQITEYYGNSQTEHSNNHYIQYTRSDQVPG